jgi:hypothetical protein
MADLFAMNSPMICRNCNVEILPTTSARTGGLCMPCSKGTRYHYVAYLSIDEFFAKASSEHCLAPNLEPHPSGAEFQSALERLSEEAGVIRCLIPVLEYEDADSQLEPSSDRVFVSGTVDESVIANWARQLQAEFYREERPGAEMPLEYSEGKPGWFLVWD